MYSIKKIALLISNYEHKINTSNNDKIPKKDFYRYFINDLEDLKNDIYTDYLTNNNFKSNK